MTLISNLGHLNKDVPRSAMEEVVQRLSYADWLILYYLAQVRIHNPIKVSKFRKQIMVPKLLPKNKPSSLSWKITTSRLIQKRVYLLSKRAYIIFFVLTLR